MFCTSKKFTTGQLRLIFVGTQLSRWITMDGGYVFVCGDGVSMSRDVKKTFTEVLVENAGLQRPDALNYIENMISDQRYVEDIWS